MNDNEIKFRLCVDNKKPIISHTTCYCCLYFKMIVYKHKNGGIDTLKTVIVKVPFKQIASWSHSAADDVIQDYADRFTNGKIKTSGALYDLAVDLQNKINIDELARNNYENIN